MLSAPVPGDPWCFGGFEDGAERVLVAGLLDRSALYGVLAEIEALGLDLLEIQKLTPDRKSPQPGDRRSP